MRSLAHLTSHPIQPLAALVGMIGAILAASALSRGALIGCTVQCPWRRSQFEVRTGRVVSGPARGKIDIYAIEIKNNEVYVKPKRSDEERPRTAA